MAAKKPLGDLVRVDYETDKDRAQIAAKHYRSLGYRVRCPLRTVRVEGELHSVWVVTVRRKLNESKRGAL